MACPKLVGHYIQPGNPQQNAYISRFNRTVRYDWLSQYIYQDIEELHSRATQWLWTYNNERPNMGIGGITPIQKLKLTQRKRSTSDLLGFNRSLQHSFKFLYRR